MTRDGAVRPVARRTLAVLAFGVLAASPALAQRAVVTSSDAVKLVVVPFARQDRDSLMAVQVANAIRERLTIAFPTRFNALSKRVIDTNLVSSGFPVDMPLDPGTARQLARVLNARLLIEGSILQLGDDSVEVVGRLSEITGALPQTASASVRIERRRVGNGTGNELANRLADYYRSFENAKECVARRQANELVRALELARQALVRYPNSSQAYLCMAQTMQAQNAPVDTVIRLLEHARDADSLNIQAMWQLARFYEQRNDTTELIHALRHIVASDPNAGDTRIALARLLNIRGHADSAISVLDSSLTRNPSQAEMLIVRSLVLAGTRRWADAAADLVRAGEVDTTKVDSAYVARLVVIYGQANDTANVIQWVRRATQRSPSQADNWYRLAALLRARNDTTGAIEAIQGYLRLLPEDGRGNIVYATLLLSREQFDSAAARATLAGTSDSMLRGSAAQVLFAVGARRLQAQDYPAAADLLGRAKGWAAQNTRFRISYYLGVSQLQMAIAADNEAQAASTRPQAQARCDAARRETDLLTQVEANVTEGGRADPDRAQQILTQAVPAYRQRATAFQRACQ